MKKLLFIGVCAVALSAGSAFAQSQPNSNGASSNGNVGPGTTRHMTHSRNGMTVGSTATRHHERIHRNSPMANPSSEGNVGPGTNNNGGPQAGGR